MIKDERDDVFGKITQEPKLKFISFSNTDFSDFISLEKIFKKYSKDAQGIEILVADADKKVAIYDTFFTLLSEISQKNLTYKLNSGLFIVYEDDKIVYLETVGDFDASLLSDAGSLEDKLDKLPKEQEILIATRNEGKTKEFQEMFAKLGYEVKNLNDYPDLPEVEETGTTFEENARLKAETISKITGKMVLADDSGLKVDVLGGLPGVWSARFAGDGASDAANNAKLLHEISSTEASPERRTAQFHTTLVVAAPDKESLVVDADWDGYIATIPKGDSGFGYDPLFVVGETGKTAAQMTLEEKNKISHRAKAMDKLMEKWGDFVK